eukprot:3434761-Rhodomonas_salina.3
MILPVPYLYHPMPQSVPSYDLTYTILCFDYPDPPMPLPTFTSTDSVLMMETLYPVMPSPYGPTRTISDPIRTILCPTTREYRSCCIIVPVGVGDEGELTIEVGCCLETAHCTPVYGTDLAYGAPGCPRMGVPGAARRGPVSGGERSARYSFDSAISLRAWGRGERSGGEDGGRGGGLCCYAPAVLCPVRVFNSYAEKVGCAISLRTCYAIPGTELAYRATVCYVMSGTDLAFCATVCYAMPGTDLAGGPDQETLRGLGFRWNQEGAYWGSAPVLSYAMSVTDIGPLSYDILLIWALFPVICSSLTKAVSAYAMPGTDRPQSSHALVSTDMDPIVLCDARY